MRKDRLALALITGVLWLFLACESNAALFTTLYSFSGGTNGQFPEGVVQGSDGNFYGTTVGDGGQYHGTVFRISASGVFTNLHIFTGSYGEGGPGFPLVQASDGNFYCTGGGGINNYGTIFKISAGGVFATLYSFGGGQDGAYPVAMVQANDGYLYGTTGGGTNGAGTVFKISTHGVFTNLYTFTGGTDGNYPAGGLVQGSDGNFYGTTEFGGTNGYGTVFKISTNGVLTPLYSFTDGNDGAYSQAPLVQGSDGNFYGTTSGDGGVGSYGSVFKISASGVFTLLHSFTGGDDGTEPVAGLTFGRDGDLYGTVGPGTNSTSDGAVFKISTNGAVTILYPLDGGGSFGVVQGSDGNWYGTSDIGGLYARGAVFRLSLTPPNQSVLDAVSAASGKFSFAFTNLSGLSFSVLATNLVTAPLATWPVIGTPIESPVGSGNYQFTNSVGTNPQFFYILRQP